METFDLAHLTVEDFRAYLQQTIDVCFVPGTFIPTRLTQITELPGYTPLARTPFSIVIQTPTGSPVYPQGIYRLEHPVHKSLEVFLVPLGPDSLGMRYEAVFS